MRAKLVEDGFLAAGVDGLGLSAGEILESLRRSSNMWPAVLALVSEIRSRPVPVLMPRRMASVLGLSSGSRESSLRRKV